MDETAARARERSRPWSASKVAVLGGFIARRRTASRRRSRGGSDYSAAIFGACLDAEEIRSDDVDGC